MSNKKSRKKIVCKKCGSEMLPNGSVVQTFPRIIVHECNKCGHHLNMFEGTY